MEHNIEQPSVRARVATRTDWAVYRDSELFMADGSQLALKSEDEWDVALSQDDVVVVLSWEATKVTGVALLTQGEEGVWTTTPPRIKESSNQEQVYRMILLTSIEAVRKRGGMKIKLFIKEKDDTNYLNNAARSCGFRNAPDTQSGEILMELDLDTRGVISPRRGGKDGYVGA